jgi:hypothetical protein
MKKTLFFLLLIFLGIQVDGQKTLKNFNGQFVFKESSFYEPITRNCYDTVVRYSKYEKKDSTIITQYVLSFDDNIVEFSYIPFKYYLNNDTIFLKYFNPITIEYVVKNAYSLKRKDTLVGSICNKFLVDSINENGKKKYFIDEIQSEPVDLNIIYRGDTIIEWNDYKLECYIFEEQTGNRRRNFKRIIFFEKDVLLPIEIKEYKYFKNETIGNIPTNKWLLTKYLKLIEIEQIK